MSKFEYDIAISFAGEDREIASEIAVELRQQEVKVFYDEYEQSKLWGANLYETLSDIYSNKAKFCLMIISESYVKKKWTKIERESAQERDFNENREYILPIRIDDTKVPGLKDTIGYLDFNKIGTTELVKMIKNKLVILDEQLGIANESSLEELPHDIPIRFEMPKEQVISKLGSPEIQGDDFTTFNKYGLVIYYISERVSGISATTLRSGTTFLGNVFGVRVGDTLAKCESLWGTPSQIEDRKLDYDVATWITKEFEIKLEIWNENGIQPVFGPYKKNQVKQIEVRKIKPTHNIV